MGPTWGRQDPGGPHVGWPHDPCYLGSYAFPPLGLDSHRQAKFAGSDFYPVTAIFIKQKCRNEAFRFSNLILSEIFRKERSD